MTATTLALIPRDGFFAKDGRGWATSARADALDWPWPTTIRGALTTASGKLYEKEGKASLRNGEDWREYQKQILLGRTVALRRPCAGAMDAPKWTQQHRMWPVPADALWVEERETVLPLLPEPADKAVLTLGRAADGMPDGYAEAREALWTPRIGAKAKPLASPRWWSETTFVKWLSGEDVPDRPEGAPRDKPPAEVHPRPASRLQVHVGIQSGTLTSEDGLLFAHDVIETLEKKAEWAIGAEVDWPVGTPPFGTPPSLARLGSDSRIAFMEGLEANLFDMPDDLKQAFAKGARRLRLVVVSPAYFDCGWLPDSLAPTTESPFEFRGQLSCRNDRADPKAVKPILDCGLILRAAFVPRPMHISGWDMAGGEGPGRDKGGVPKRTSRIVPSGAVYFVEKSGGSTFTPGEIEKLWLAPIGGRTHEGFGRIVPGI